MCTLIYSFNVYQKIQIIEFHKMSQKSLFVSDLLSSVTF